MDEEGSGDQEFRISYKCECGRVADSDKWKFIEEILKSYDAATKALANYKVERRICPDCSSDSIYPLGADVSVRSDSPKDRWGKPVGYDEKWVVEMATDQEFQAALDGTEDLHKSFPVESYRHEVKVQKARKFYPLAMRLWTAFCIVGFLTLLYAGLYQPDWISGVPEVEDWRQVLGSLGLWAFAWWLNAGLMNRIWGDGNGW